MSGRQNGKKKIVVIAIEKRERGISRIYGKVIERSSAKELGDFMRQTIDPKAQVQTDQWSGYTPVRQCFENMRQVPSGKKGCNFPDMHRAIMGFKGWLRGMHGHAPHLQAYVDEYCYRFNRSNMKERIFDNLICKLICAKPITHKMIYSIYA